MFSTITPTTDRRSPVKHDVGQANGKGEHSIQFANVLPELGFHIEVPARPGCPICGARIAPGRAACPGEHARMAYNGWTR